MAFSSKPYLLAAGAGLLAVGALAGIVAVTHKPAGPVPASSNPSKGTSAQTAQPQATTPAPSCDPTKTKPLDPVQLAGTWTDEKTGETAEISQKNPGDTTNFTLKSDHAWDGIYKDGKLTFTRKPTADEISHDAPDWARKAVEGSLQWSLEFTPQSVCDVAELKGNWYPGLIRIEEPSGTPAPGMTTSRGSASVAGKGDPIEVDYKPGPQPKMFLFARTTAGRQYIEEFYVGVPTEIELQFEKPHDGKSFPVDLSVGDQKVTLVASKADDEGYIFRTDAFVPRPAAPDKSQVFNPPPPPRRTP